MNLRRAIGLTLTLAAIAGCVYLAVSFVPAKLDPGEPARKPDEKYFKGWEKPQLALVITGEQNGYMEPCGCAGLENQKGGIGRRHDLFQQLTAKGWPVAAVDVGGLVRRFGKQAELQFAASAQALQTMGYQAVGFGKDDLKLSTSEVATVASQGMFSSANADILGLVPAVRIFEAGGLKIGVISVLGDEYQKEINNGELAFKRAADGISELLPQIANCDHRILLSNAPVDESQDLAKKFPAFDIVVTAGTHGEPANYLKEIDGRAFVETGDKGMFAIVLGFYPGQKKPRYERVALDKRFQVTPDMKKIMAELQDQYKTLGWEGLGIKQRPHARAAANDPLMGQFVGSTSCRDCHPRAYEIWHKSGHAHATDTLVNSDPPRQFDPECVSCHVTGWNATDYYPYDSGFLGLKEAPHLLGSGCENCHGPGAAHVAAEGGKDKALQQQLRDLMHLPHEKAEQSCRTCHDLDNSPAFKYDEYWKKIAH